MKRCSASNANGQARTLPARRVVAQRQRGECWTDRGDLPHALPPDAVDGVRMVTEVAVYQVVRAVPVEPSYAMRLEKGTSGKHASPRTVTAGAAVAVPSVQPTMAPPNSGASTSEDSPDRRVSIAPA
jgi:hypothetical protein